MPPFCRWRICTVILARDLCIAARPITLTAREYELLVLMQQPGQVFGQRASSCRLKEERSGSSNVVEVCVRYLRQKLEKQGNLGCSTVRGIGYRLGAEVDSL